MADPVSSDLDDSVRRRVLIAVAVFANLLFLATWRLWLGGETDWTTEHSSFPRIPFLGFAGSLPAELDYLFFAVTVASTLAFAFSNSRIVTRWALVCFVAGSISLVLVDQHRLQPWLYLFILLGFFALLLSSKQFVVNTRWLLISVYLFSAWSKFDYSFVHSLGQQFIDTLLAPFGDVSQNLDRTTRSYVALLFPLTEFAVGLGLCWKLTRKFAAATAILLHVCLIGILGPWGLGHHLGVLIWNLFFIPMIWILFWKRSERVTDPTPKQRGDGRLRQWFTVTVIMLPLLEPLGLLDHWPAWQVYAPRNSRVTMEVMSHSLEKLPADLTPFVREDETSPWARVDLDAWSLVRLSSPNYPRDRFQLAVALAVAKNCELGEAVQVTLQGTANRRNGTRETKVLRGIEEIAKAAQRFRLNALPPE